MNGDYRMFGKRRSWCSLRYDRGICLEGLEETTNYLKQNGLFPARFLNPKFSEHKAGMLSNRLSFWVRSHRICYFLEIFHFKRHRRIPRHFHEAQIFCECKVIALPLCNVEDMVDFQLLTPISILKSR